MKDLKVGDEVWILTVGNNSRYKISRYRVKVQSVGRKWFKVTREDIRRIEDEKFSLEDGWCDGRGYSPEWRSFKTEEEVISYVELPNVRLELINLIERLNYQEICQILANYNNK